MLSGKVEKCTNSSNITNNVSTTWYTNVTVVLHAGGIIGYGAAGTVVDCNNSGSISASDSHPQYGTVYVAGIVGQRSNNLEVVSCNNSGSTTANSDGSRINDIANN